MFMVCGESLMDVFVTADTATGALLDARIGGSPLNVAIGLARLGQAVEFLGALSTDRLGQRLRRALAQEGVGLAHAQTVDAPTTLGLVGLDADGAAAYTFYGHCGADRQLQLHGLAAAAPGAAALHVGSYAMLVEPIASTLRSLIERKRQRCVVSYDPNLRLGVEPDLGAWRQAVAWTVARAHLVKVSADDVELLYPGVPLGEVAAEWLQRGATVVVITCGGRGAQGFRRRAQVRIDAAAVELLDSVGAGDSFQAAWLAWLADNGALSIAALRALTEAQLRAALSFAARAAAVTCARRGADLPRRSELT